MEINLTIPIIYIVNAVPHKLQQWWTNIRVAHGYKIRRHLVPNCINEYQAS